MKYNIIIGILSICFTKHPLNVRKKVSQIRKSSYTFKETFHASIYLSYGAKKFGNIRSPKHCAHIWCINEQDILYHYFLDDERRILIHLNDDTIWKRLQDYLSK